MATRDPDRARCAAHDEPRRHPPPRGRDAAPAHIAVQVRRQPGDGAGRDQWRHRLSVLDQAGDVVVRQGAVAGEIQGRRRRRVAIRGVRRPRARLARDRRRLHRLRLRDHAVDGARAWRERRHRDPFLRADRPRAGQRRLCRIVAAAADDGRRAGQGARHCRARSRRSWAAAASSASSCSSRATWSGFPKSARGRTTPGWSRCARSGKANSTCMRARSWGCPSTRGSLHPARPR